MSFPRFSAFLFISLLLLEVTFSIAARADGLYNCHDALDAFSATTELHLENPYYLRFEKDIASVVMMKSPLLFSKAHYEAVKAAFTGSPAGYYQYVHGGLGNERENITKATWERIKKYYDGSETEINEKALALGITGDEFIKVKRLISAIEQNPDIKEVVFSFISKSLESVFGSSADYIRKLKFRQDFYDQIVVDRPLVKPISVEAVNFEDGKVTLRSTYKSGAQREATYDLVDFLTVKNSILFGPVYFDAVRESVLSSGYDLKSFKKSFESFSDSDLQNRSTLVWNKIKKDYADLFNTSSAGNAKDSHFLHYAYVNALDTNLTTRNTIVSLIKENFKTSLNYLRVGDFTKSSRAKENPSKPMVVGMSMAVLSGALSLTDIASHLNPTHNVDKFVLAGTLSTMFASKFVLPKSGQVIQYFQKKNMLKKTKKTIGAIMAASSEE